MNAFARIALLSSSLVLLAACGKSNGSAAGSASASTTVTSGPVPKGGSCNEEKVGVCTEYADNPMGLASGACASLYKGTYSKGSCPTQNLIGTCQGKDDKEFYYFGNGIASWADDAKEECEKNPLSPGKFTAQPNIDQAAKDNALPPPSHIVASCQKKDGSCEDIDGRMADMEKSMCEDGGEGTYGENKTCSVDALVGSCVKRGKVSRYYTANLKSSSVKELTQQCEGSFLTGHWYPGPAAPVAKAAASAKGMGAAKPSAAKAKK